MAGRMTQVQNTAFLFQQRSGKGQGVIEYAGGLVIAAIIVSAGLIIIPPGFTSLFNTIFTSVSSFMSSYLPS